jgi:hypothetical protein
LWHSLLRSFGNTILNEYGSVTKIAIGFLLSKQFFWPFIFLPKYRNAIRFWLFSLLFLYVLFILQNGISEYFFWNEFGVCYNFIAVNYLIYTNEVIGNIMESYPVIPLFSAFVCISWIHHYISLSKIKNYIENIPLLYTKIKISGIYISFFNIAYFYLIYRRKKIAKCICEWVTSQRIYKFYFVFCIANWLFKFYKTIPLKKLSQLKATNPLQEEYMYIKM